MLQNERAQFSTAGPADPLTSSGTLFMVGPLCRETVPSLSRLRALGLHRSIRSGVRPTGRRTRPAMITTSGSLLTECTVPFRARLAR